MDAILKIVGSVVVIVVLVFIGAALTALPVMWLWNWLMPSIAHLRAIHFTEAWGLAVLCGLLFKSSAKSTA